MKILADNICDLFVPDLKTSHWSRLTISWKGLKKKNLVYGCPQSVFLNQNWIFFWSLIKNTNAHCFQINMRNENGQRKLKWAKEMKWTQKMLSHIIAHFFHKFCYYFRLNLHFCFHQTIYLKLIVKYYTYLCWRFKPQNTNANC